MLLTIDKFTEEQQREIYDQDYHMHVQSVADYFGDDVVSAIIGKVTHEPKWSILDVGLTSSLSSESRAYANTVLGDKGVSHFERYATPYYDELFVLCDVFMDIDPLGRERCDYTRPDLLREHVGLTLSEALVALQLSQDDRMTFVKEIRDHRARIIVHKLYDLEYDDHTDSADLSECARELLQLAAEGNLPLVHENDAPMYAGSNPVKDLYLTSYEVLESDMFYGACELEFKDSDVEAVRDVLDGMLSKLYDYFHSFLSELASDLQEEWDYRTSFESWVEHAEGNEIEFNPENYGIHIEEIESV